MKFISSMKLIIFLCILLCIFMSSCDKTGDSSGQNTKQIDPDTRLLQERMDKILPEISYTKEEFLERVKETIENKDDLNAPKMSRSPLFKFKGGIVR